MGYKSKFKGAEIDAHLEKMVNVTYAELKALRDEGKLIAGQMYRMTDYETTCGWENTQCAGHPFDLVLTALDNKTLDEKCSAIWSERDTDGYFANSNLPAWDVRYCLDNDVIRFDWARQKGKYLVVDDDGYQYIGKLNGTYTLDGVTYKKWDVNDSGYLMYLLTLSENPNEGEEIIVCDFQDGDYNWTAVAVKVEDRTDGNGVIYRLIDELENSIPYDFKNIMFMRPLTEGVLDFENGVATFCYTFSYLDFDTYAIEDKSVKEPLYCYNNKFTVYCFDNVFLALSEDNCHSNIFGDHCVSNTFVGVCDSNIFGDNCVANTFGSGCSSNIFKNNCHSNTFGFGCDSNTFGDNCHSNIFGDMCDSNTFGYECYSNTFGDNCSSNIFGNNCDSNTFGDMCYSNTFGSGCSYNTFKNNCYSNIFGDYFSFNTFGDNCHSNTFVNNETASYRSLVQYYKIDCVSEKEIQVYRNRKYQIFITTDTSRNIVEYTVDDIINK